MIDLKCLTTYLILLPLFLLSGISQVAQAQCSAAFGYPSVGGSFYVTEVQGCPGTTIEVCIDRRVAICGCEGSGCLCNIEYEKNVFDNSSSPAFQYTYNTPGTYQLVILYPSSGIDSVKIEITDKGAPDFEAYSCVGNTVKVDIQDTQYDNYNIDFGDGTATMIPRNGTDPEHTYASAATRTISVQGLDDDAVPNCPVATESFTPVGSIIAPVLTQLRTIDESSLEISSQLEANVFYQLEIQPNGSGAFAFIKHITTSAAPDTVGRLDLINNFYCFRLASIDPCAEERFYSNVVCSIPLELDVADGVNELVWRTSNPTSDFRLVRTANTATGSTVSDPHDTFSASTRTYDDTDISCEIEYCYQIEADFSGGRSISNEQCAVSFTTASPQAVDDIAIVVEPDGTLVLAWEAPEDIESATYAIESKDFLATTEQTRITDNLQNGQSGSVCYQIGTTDECGNEKISPTAFCSIFVSGFINRANEIELSWNEYVGYADGVDAYRVDKFYDGSLEASFTVNSLLFNEVDNNDREQNINYRITALPTNTTSGVSVSNTLTLVKSNRIHYPTAFTPDGNGVNDTFTVSGKFLVEYNLKIYNRWGEMVFVSNDETSGWDGTFKGKPQQEGTYVFDFSASDLGGQELKRNGTFILLRKQ